MKLLLQLSRIVMHDGRHAEWLDMETASSLCHENGLQLEGKYPNSYELESKLKTLFQDVEEINVDGLNVVAYDRRKGWDLNFMVRFYLFNPLASTDTQCETASVNGENVRKDAPTNITDEKATGSSPACTQPDPDIAKIGYKVSILPTVIPNLI